MNAVAVAHFDEKPRRPALRWHGGKWLLAPWIISHFPAHRVYVEPFGGAASVLLRKGRAYSEVYNDLDGEVVNLFRVLRIPSDAATLIASLKLTPFSRTEFEAAYDQTAEPIERARRLVIRSFMGHGSDAPNLKHRTGFRSNSTRSGTTPAHDWANYPEGLARVVARLIGVVVERRDACEVMAAHDGPETLHYVDPPYVHATRSRSRGEYVHEMSDADHARLLDCLLGLGGGCRAVRIRPPALRARAEGLAPSRAGLVGGRRPAAPRGAVDKPGRCAAEPVQGR